MQETDESALRRIYDDMFSDKLLIKATKLWLPFLDERGLLDTLILKK